MKKIKTKYKLVFLLIFAISSCDGNSNFLDKNKGETIFYEIIFQNKEKKKSVYRQSYNFLSKDRDFLPVLKNNGEIIAFFQNEGGISQTTLKNNSLKFNELKENENSKVILAFPIEKGTKWITNDKTTLQMKLGYDRVYNTNLPLTLENVIEKTNDTISLNGRKIKNCVKIASYGKTSFNPGPPLTSIDIEVFVVTWYSESLGIVRYKREERSNSETMGSIFYEKSIIVD